MKQRGGMKELEPSFSGEEEGGLDNGFQAPTSYLWKTR